MAKRSIQELVRLASDSGASKKKKKSKSSKKLASENAALRQQLRLVRVGAPKKRSAKKRPAKRRAV